MVKNKKSQITLFVIISLTILIVIVMIVFLKNNFKVKDYNEKQEFVSEDCIKNLFYKKMENIGLKGGINSNYYDNINLEGKELKVNYGLYFLKPNRVYDWDLYGNKYGIVLLPKLNVIKEDVEKYLKNNIVSECNYNVENVEVLFNDEKTLLFLKLKKDNKINNVRIEFNLPFKKIYYYVNEELYKESNEENHNFTNFYNKDFSYEYYNNINGKDDLFILKTKNTDFNGESYKFYTLIKDRLPYVKDNLDCKITFSKNIDKYKILNFELKDEDKNKIVDSDEKDILGTNYDYEILSCKFLCGESLKSIREGIDFDECKSFFENIMNNHKNFFYGKVDEIRLSSDGEEYEGKIKI